MANRATMDGLVNAKALIAACLLTGCLGSIHAFSVFVVPLEQTLAVGRAAVSLIYSLALVSLTLAVLLGHRLYGRCAPAWLAVAVCGLAALGLALAAVGGALPAFYVGYSLLFGAANGVGYGFALTLASHSGGARKGLAMGAVTAAYALGATAFAKLFALLIAWGGVALTLGAMAAVMVAVALLVGFLLRDQMRLLAALPSGKRQGSVGDRQVGVLLRLWFGYGFGVAAGLMAIGHAAGLVLAAGGRQSDAVAGAMLIGLGNALGGVTAGWLADRWSLSALLIGLPLLSAIILFGLSVASGVALVVAGLAAVGFTYGAIIVVYPAAVAACFGPADFARAYGRVFTAWGAAGLAAPWLAGVLFDSSGNYAIALLVAGMAALLSALAALSMPRNAAR